VAEQLSEGFAESRVAFLQCLLHHGVIKKEAFLADTDYWTYLANTIVKDRQGKGLNIMDITKEEGQAYLIKYALATGMEDHHLIALERQSG
jgi:hypothetical protein